MALDLKPEVAAEREQRAAVAESIVAKLRAGGPRRPVFLPTGDDELELELRLITGAQQLEATARAHGVLEAKGLAEKFDREANLETIQIVECLAFSLVDPSSGAQVFDNGTKLADVVGEHTLSQLTVAYAELTLEGELAAGSRLMRRELEDALKKKEVTTLSAIAPKLPRALLLTMVGQLCTLLADKSGSSPPSEG